MPYPKLHNREKITYPFLYSIVPQEEYSDLGEAVTINTPKPRWVYLPANGMVSLSIKMDADSHYAMNGIDINVGKINQGQLIYHNSDYTLFQWQNTQQIFTAHPYSDVVDISIILPGANGRVLTHETSLSNLIGEQAGGKSLIHFPHPVPESAIIKIELTNRSNEALGVCGYIQGRKIKC